MKKITNSEQFCQDLLELDIKYAKAFANTVIALSSYEDTKSVVGLSESPLFLHQYSSIRDGIHGVGLDEEEQSATMDSITELGLKYLWKKKSYDADDWLILQTDASGVKKGHSSCLKERQYIKISNNVIHTNKPISVGYPISLVNVSIPPLSNKWSLPLNICRISSSQSAVECSVEQVNELICDKPKEGEKRGLLCNSRIINTLDSGYGCPAYISPTFKYEKLVNIIRFRYGKKVWIGVKHPPKKEENNDKKIGTPKIYGEKYYLIDNTQTKKYHRKGESYEVYQQSIFDLPYQDNIELSGKTSKGRQLKIVIHRWNDLLIRSKDGHNMKDKPFDIVASKVIDADTGELVFNKTMFTTIHGELKNEISTKQAFETYRHRYDIEPSIKFCKQKLMLENYQTPDVQHFDNWLVIVMTAFWLLFTAAPDVKYQPKKWQQYKEKNKKASQQTDKEQVILSPCQTRQAAQALFLTFDSQPFTPQKSKKGQGREKDTTLYPRTRHKVVKKNRKNVNSS